MIRDTLLALGVMLSTASQLRPAEIPIGPGELCLMIWVGWGLCHEVGRLGPPMTAALSLLLVFWAVFAIAQSVGLVVGLAIESFRDTSGMLHDIVSYTLMASLTLLIVSLPETWRRLRRVTWIIVVGGAGSLVVQLADAYGMISFPAIDPWYWHRFRGWSENPNQMALLCSALVLLALHLAETAEGPGERSVALLCVGLVFPAGVLTRSDTFILFVLIGCPMLIAFKLWTWLFLVERGLSLRATIACMGLLSGPPLLVGVVPISPAIVEKIENFTAATLEDNNQAEMRYKLWKEAVNLGIGSWMLGLGPGPHLIQKDFKRPPPAKFEAHNIILDLFTQGGALAVLSFVWLIVTAFLAALRARMFALSTLVCALAMFSMFHLIVRHPVFWFAIALCLVAADRARVGRPKLASSR
jgi:hypothetical protein